MSKPKRCWGNGAKLHHCAGCRPGRPLCRWRRAAVAKYAPCHCGAYAFPHRFNSGMCGSREALNEVLWGRGDGQHDEARQGLEDAAAVA